MQFKNIFNISDVEKTVPTIRFALNQCLVGNKVVLILKGDLETPLNLLPTIDNHVGGNISPKEDSSCCTAVCKQYCQTWRLWLFGVIYLAALSEGAPVLSQPP